MSNSSTLNGSTAKTYDRNYLLESVDGNAEIAREIVALYVNESPAMIGRLAKLIELEDTEAIESAAHRLKGAMLAIGARAAAIAAELEEHAEAGELDRCREKFALLTLEAKALNQALIDGELGGAHPAS